jgi:hypothetical protein
LIDDGSGADARMGGAGAGATIVSFKTGCDFDVAFFFGRIVVFCTNEDDTHTADAITTNE